MQFNSNSWLGAIHEHCSPSYRNPHPWLEEMAVAGAFRTPTSYPRFLPPLCSTHILLYYIDTSSPKVGDGSFAVPPRSPLTFLRSFPQLVPQRITHRLPSTLGSHTFCRRLFCSQTLSIDTEFGIEVGEVRKFKKRLRIVDLKGGPDEGLDRIGQSFTIRGWVRTCRIQSSVTFIEVNDGSCLSNMQCVINSASNGYIEIESGSVGIGASVLMEGTLVRSEGSKQKVELKVERLALIGKSDPSSYPIQKKRVSREFLRTVAHLRPRTSTFGAVTRVRNALAYATHQFFHENGFLWISTPIITASDCEGAGEQFCVTTLIPGTREDEGIPFDEVPTTRNDFFGKPAFLTVSGQLNAETYASALSDVYTFGPTFRAENSNTSRHLAEFWMIEPELAFADLNDDMACATAYLQYVVKYVLENCKEDMKFFETWIEKGIINRLSGIVEKDFIQLTYTDAIELLLKAEVKFEFPVKWGTNLQSEHERYITEKAFSGRPVIIRDYPKDVKAFYMRLNDDKKTVAAMDVLVPRVGELIGGSQREERLEYLERRLEELNLPQENYWWYLDIRRFGSVPHAGFGLGFERLVQFATGMENIRDVIPFPRTPGSAEF